MTILYLLVPIALLIAGFFLSCFLWANRNDQFEDLASPSYKPFLDDLEDKSSERTVL